MPNKVWEEIISPFSNFNMIGVVQMQWPLAILLITDMWPATYFLKNSWKLLMIILDILLLFFFSIILATKTNFTDCEIALGLRPLNLTN